MSKYDDDYQDYDDEDDDYNVESDDDEDEKEESSRKSSSLNPFSTSARPASPFGTSAPPGSRPGDSSRLPGNPPASRPPFSSNQPGSPGSQRPGMSGNPPSSPYNRPAAPGGSSSGNPPSSPYNRPATPAGSSGSSGSSGVRPSPFSSGGSSGVRPSPFSGGEKKDDRKEEDKSGGLGRFAPRFGGEKKDDKSGGGRFSLFGGKKEDKPATPKGLKDEGRGGGLLGGLRRGDDKPATPKTSTGTTRSPFAGSASSPAQSPFGSRVGGTSAPSSAGGRAPAKPQRQGLGQRLKSFSLFKKSEPKPARARPARTPTVKAEGMSLDTKLDILGVVLVLGSLGLLFSALSPNQGQLTGGVNLFLAQTFGWGAAAVPVFMLAIGVWLILRHFGDEAPVLDTMRVIGLGILYVGVLVAFQYIDSFSYELVPGANYLDQLRDVFLPLSYTLGKGGGYIGAEIYFFLISNLGEVLGVFILLAWMLIGAMFALKLSAAEMAIIVISLFRSFNDARRRRAQAQVMARAQQEAPPLPQISVTKPAEGLPSGRSPALPAPTSAAEAAEGRSIPIMQGGRTVSAPFHPGDALPAENPPAPENAPLPLPFAAPPVSAGTGSAGEKPSGALGRLGGFMGRGRSAPAEEAAKAGAEPASASKADEDEKAGGAKNRFGLFSSRAAKAVPESDANADAKPTESKDAKAAAEAGEKPAGASRFGAFTARVRDAMPAPAAKTGEKIPDAEKPAAPTGRFGSVFNRTREDKPAAGAPDNAVESAKNGQPAAAPERSGSLSRRTREDKPVTDTPGERDQTALAAAAAEPSQTQAVRDEEEKPVRLGSLLRPAVKETPPAVTSTEQPAASAQAESPPPPPSSGEADKPAEDSARGALPNPFDSKPAAPRPSPFSRAVPPPVVKPKTGDNGDENEDEDDEEDLSKLPPARPKGLGALPRPLASPFSRPPQRETPSAFMPPPKQEIGSLQERLERLRNMPSPAQPEAAETPKAESAAPETETTEAPPAAPAGEETTAATPPVPAPAPAMPTSRRSASKDDEDQKDDGETTADEPTNGAPAADDLEKMPTLTKGSGLGIRLPSPFASSKAESEPPAAFKLPERPTPSASPARSTAFTPPTTPPVTPPAPRSSQPPPPQAPRGKRAGWSLPDYAALLASGSDQELNHSILIERARIIEETLASFGAPGRVVEVRTGPVITQFGVEPDYLAGRSGKKIRVKVSAIAQLDKDLQLALGAKSIRIEAPVPGKGYVGVEVPNSEPSIVRLRDVLDSQEFRKIKSPLAMCLGQGVDGTPVAADLGVMPHLLIAGTTGSGKSVCVNAIIASLLIRNTPDKLKLIMVDPKRVELTGYNGIPHLVAPVVVELERIVSVLKWVTREMDERYKRFSSAGARNIEDYNKHLPQGQQIMPYIVVIIDELADLMMLAPDETERVITRIAALARATGIHLVIATQRPSVDVVTGLIKANFPARIAFAVAGSVDSRVILDQPGAERLLGRGDMLYMSGDSPAPLRLQGVFVSDAEINNITHFWRTQVSDDDLAARPALSHFALDEMAGDSTASSSWSPQGKRGVSSQQQAFWDRELRDAASGHFDDEADDDEDNDGDDEMYDQAVELVRRLNKASVSLLQRRLRIGYTRAARLIDMMEERGIVGPPVEGSKPREVLPVK